MTNHNSLPTLAAALALASTPGRRPNLRGPSLTGAAARADIRKAQ